MRKRGSCRPTSILWAVLFAGLLVLAACDAVQVVESSATAVTVRYDGLANGLDDATQLAERACAAHGKIAHLRKVAYQGLGAGERYAHFDCV